VDYITHYLKATGTFYIFFLLFQAEDRTFF